MPSADGLWRLLSGRQIRGFERGHGGRRLQVRGRGGFGVRLGVALVREGAVVARQGVLFAVLRAGGGASDRVVAPLREVVPFVGDALPGDGEAFGGVDDGDGALAEELFSVFGGAVFLGAESFGGLSAEGGFTTAPFGESEECTEAEGDGVDPGGVVSLNNSGEDDEEGADPC